MRTEPHELKMKAARRPRVTARSEPSTRKLQVNVFPADTIDEAFASLSAGGQPDTPQVTLTTGPPQSVRSSSERLRDNQAIVSEIARQLETLEMQRRKLTSLLDELHDKS